MNLRSSSTPRFVGSAIATVSVRPSRLSGRTRCLIARSAGISFAMRGSTSNRERSTAGILNWRASIFVSSVSCDEAELDEVVADPRAVLLLLLERLLQLLARDEPLADEEVTDSFGGGGWCGHVAGWEDGGKAGEKAPIRRILTTRLTRKGDERGEPSRVAGPIPFTRRRADKEPKGPRESRLATMRRARAGPTRGGARSPPAGRVEVDPRAARDGRCAGRSAARTSGIDVGPGIRRRKSAWCHGRQSFRSGTPVESKFAPA